MRILVGDIGGTKTLLALHEGHRAGALQESHRRRFENDRWSSLAPILREFLGDHEGLDAAAFGIAGPVADGVCRATNLPWVIDARALATQLAIPHVGLINDFEAIALGLDLLPPDALCTLQDRPVDPSSPRAVVGAGTGLGEAILVPRQAGLPQVLATEGGHVDFPARDEVEIDLLRFAQRRFGRVCVERVVSGPGLALVYDHVVASGAARPATSVHGAPPDADRSALIGQSGLRGDEPATRLALERFVSLYGAEAGNLALKSLPYGGLYVAGGIAPKILDALRSGPFMSSFLAKGRMRSVLDKIRVSVVIDPAVGLLGARRKAVALLRA